MYYRCLDLGQYYTLYEYGIYSIIICTTTDKKNNFSACILNACIYDYIGTVTV